MPRTIDDILPPSRRRAANDSKATDIDTPDTDTSDDNRDRFSGHRTPPRVRINTGRSFPYGTAIIALLVIAISAGALYAFAGAKVEIQPKSQSVQVSGSFSATQGTGSLPFTLITVNKTASAFVPAESTETVNDSAQGTITVSNTLSTPETFVANTRFETPAGLVFRVHAPITIPAATASGPGTVSAMVYADQPGQEYNVGPTTFTVPGLMNYASEYSAITARSTNAMIGGFTGTRASVGQSTDSSQQSTLQSTLATELQSDITSQIPSGDVLVPGSTFTSYTSVPDTATTTTTVEVSEQGTLTAVVFPNSALAQAIAYKQVGTYEGEPVTTNSVNSLNLSSASTTVPTSGTETFNFNLSGSATIVWTVDPSKIAGAIAGKTRDSAQSILAGFPEVDQATLYLRPFWANTFPADPSRIQVVIEKPANQ